jgi:hypothetical protein
VDVQVSALRHLVEEGPQSNRALLSCFFKCAGGARFRVDLTNWLRGLCVQK